MIDRITPFPFPIVDADRTCGGSAASQGQGNSFLDLLARNLEKPEALQMASLPSLNPTALSPYATELQNDPMAQESPMRDVIRFVLKQEGSTYVSRDGGKESSKFGILQSTARGYGFQGSIKDLTRPQAEAIYEKMWHESGAQKLPRDLAIVHFDTYINSPVAARKMLKACGGDTENYLNLRAQRYMHLAEKRPERFAKYVKGWMNRVERLRTMVAQYDTASSANGST
jgi:lysozyme family protein